MQGLGRVLQGFTRYHLGDFVAARTLLERAHRAIVLKLGADRERIVLHPSSPTVRHIDLYTTVVGHLGNILACLGYTDQARSRLNEALSEARRLRHAFTLANVLFHASSIDWLTRSAHLKSHAEELSTLATDHGFQLASVAATILRGWSLTTIGQVQEGLALLTEGLVAIQATEAVTCPPGVLVALAEACAMLGRPAEGLKYLAEAAQIVEATEQRRDEAELFRARGDLQKAIGDRSAAEQSYRQSLAVAQRQSAKLFELRAATSLARLWREQGKIADAQALLAPIHKWFTEGFDAPDLVEAKALLEHLQRA